MINFSRSGNNIKASVRFKSGDIDTSMFFYLECHDEITAQCTADKLQEFMRDTIEREIKTAYEAGYKTGRQKKTKRGWFHRSLTHINESLPDWKINH